RSRRAESGPPAGRYRYYSSRSRRRGGSRRRRAARRSVFYSFTLHRINGRRYDVAKCENESQPLRGRQKAKGGQGDRGWGLVINFTIPHPLSPIPCFFAF